MGENLSEMQRMNRYSKDDGIVKHCRVSHEPLYVRIVRAEKPSSKEEKQRYKLS